MSYLGTYVNGKNQQPLTLEEIARYAPSAMAIEPHHSRSDRYTYIPTVQIIQGLMNNGFMPFSATQSRTRIADKREFTKHMIRFRHVGQEFNRLMVGDVVPEIALINSHDGTSLYKLIAGLLRKVCMNGLMVSESEIASIAVPHKGNIADRVIEGSYRLLESSEKTVGTVQRWTGLQLTAGEQSALADAAHTLRFADAEGKITTPITATQLLQPRRSADTGNDLWKTFNRVQENVIRGGLHGVQRDANGRRLRAVSTREVRGIDQDVRLNRALWTLGERMAELKQAQ